MARGSTHVIGNLLSAMCGVLQVHSNEAGAAWVAGSLFGILLSSDLDQIEENGDRVGGYYGQEVIRQTFPAKIGSFLSNAWWWIWQPYAHAFKHRSWLSHLPPFCTAIRLVYIFPITILFYFIFRENFSYFLIALIASDVIHWAFDWRVWHCKLLKLIDMEMFKQ